MYDALSPPGPLRLLGNVKRKRKHYVEPLLLQLWTPADEGYSNTRWAQCPRCLVSERVEQGPRKGRTAMGYLPLQGTMNQIDQRIDQH